MSKPSVILRVRYRFSALWNQGIQGLILDLDNTLVCWDKSVMEDRFREWIKEAKRHGLKYVSCQMVLLNE